MATDEVKRERKLITVRLKNGEEETWPSFFNPEIFTGRMTIIRDDGSLAVYNWDFVESYIESPAPKP